MNDYTEQCDRCNEPAEFHIETATSAECLCNHCRRVSWSNILAHIGPVASADLTLAGKSERIGLQTLPEATT